MSWDLLALALSAWFLYIGAYRGLYLRNIPLRYGGHALGAAAKKQGIVFVALGLVLAVGVVFQLLFGFRYHLPL